MTFHSRLQTSPNTIEHHQIAHHHKQTTNLTETDTKIYTKPFALTPLSSQLPRNHRHSPNFSLPFPVFGIIAESTLEAPRKEFCVSEV